MTLLLTIALTLALLTTQGLLVYVLRRWMRQTELTFDRLQAGTLQDLDRHQVVTARQKRDRNQNPSPTAPPPILSPTEQYVQGAGPDEDVSELAAQAHALYESLD